MDKASDDFKVAASASVPGQRGFDYLVVGAGFAGSVLAERLASQLDQRVLVVDKRPHIGGNAHDRHDDAGLLVHPYGPHIFHTNSAEIFDYLSRFTQWRAYQHRVLASVDGQLLPIPINLDTVNRLYGMQLTTFELRQFLASVAEPREPVRTAEDAVIRQVGRDLGEIMTSALTEVEKAKSITANLTSMEADVADVADDLAGDLAPTLSAEQQQVIEDMLEAAVQTPEPTPEACQRYYDAHKPRFTHGQQAQLRHILFAVTPGVPVQKLAERAEAALLELTHKDAPADRFAQLAAELSNCPSGAQGGDLGWVGPQDCAPELAQFLFMQEGGIAKGLQPRLVHSRFGLHIVDVLDQRPGELAAFDQVQGRIAGELTLQSRATALRQYMLLLVGQARVEGIDLEGADTPLVQ